MQLILSVGSLEEFLYTAKQLRLPVTSGQCHRKMAAAFGMNPKKAHEVEEASQLISTLAVKHGLKQVNNDRESLQYPVFFYDLPLNNLATGRYNCRLRSTCT